MSRVEHRIWGIGNVIKREKVINGVNTEVEYGGNYITVSFEDGTVKPFAIPASFAKGHLTALDDYAEEVADVTEAIERARLEAFKDSGITDGRRDDEDSDEWGEKIPARITVTGNLKEDFRVYLTETGYRPNVVYSYANEVGRVCAEENVSWKTLLLSIGAIVRMYGEGGVKESIGNEHNKTVINALKRYRDFYIKNPDAI